MKKDWSEDELKEIAKQLSNPDGTEGVKTGERMSHGNGMMIHAAVDAMHFKGGDSVLEIGPGNGAHVQFIVEKGESISYHGVDISTTMIQEATEINRELALSESVSFTLSDGKMLNFSDSTFDKIFTVNTVYFWGNPAAYALEILRVLKIDGMFGLAFADSKFMESLPFTKFGFQLYSKESGEELLKNAGFEIEKTIEDMEITTSNLGEKVERPVIIVLAKKVK